MSGHGHWIQKRLRLSTRGEHILVPSHLVQELLIRLIGIESLIGPVELQHSMIHVNTEGILLGGIISDAVFVSKIAKAEDVGHLGVVKIDRTQSQARCLPQSSAWTRR